MCGFVGKLIFNEGEINRDLLINMASRLSHRGPDQEGVHISQNKKFGLGFRRLSIIDRSEAGSQPMSNEDGTIWIAFNGEIYNFQELRKNLESRHRFSSRTDTECVLHLYEDHGINCLQFLRGMFAFALYDSKKKVLFLARDRLGKKPLKWYVDKKGVVFASELKALFADPAVPKEVDEEAVSLFLSLQYVPAPKTGFLKIHKLPAAHYLEINGNTITLRRYWKLDYSKKEDHDEKEWVKLIREKLEESVRLRMIADVPLGSFLSGGIDSSIVTGIMAQNSKNPVKTFSMGFKDRALNELHFARAVARRFKTDHQEFVLRKPSPEFLQKMARHFEEPFSDPAAIPLWLLSEQSKPQITVALTGDGGDENFAGYTRYHYQRWNNLFFHLPNFIKTSSSRLAEWLSHTTPSSSFFWKLKRFLENPMKTAESRYGNLLFLFLDREKKRSETDAWLKEQFNILPQGLSSLERLLLFDLQTYLADDLLPKMDMASMAHGLEVRSPFLDHTFFELTSKIPEQLKNGKHLLIKAFQDLLPPEILKRKKQGFRLPLQQWFKKDFSDLSKSLLLSQNAFVKNFIQEDTLYGIFKEPSSHFNAHRMYTLLMLELWHKAWFF